MKRALTVLLLLSTVLGMQTAYAGDVASESGPVETRLILSVPGSRGATYGTPVVVVQPNDELRFLNADLFVHDVRSVAMGPDDTRRCNPPEADEPPHPKRNPRRFPLGKCPLLWTPPIAVTNGVFESKVYGTENLEPGKTFEFYCTVFPNMRGQVIVP